MCIDISHHIGITSLSASTDWLKIGWRSRYFCCVAKRVTGEGETCRTAPSTLWPFWVHHLCTACWHTSQCQCTYALKIANVNKQVQEWRDDLKSTLWSHSVSEYKMTETVTALAFTSLKWKLDWSCVSVLVLLLVCVNWGTQCEIPMMKSTHVLNLTCHS